MFGNKIIDLSTLIDILYFIFNYYIKNKNINMEDNKLGDQLLTKDGYQSTKNVIENKKFVGIFFSALWCSYCVKVCPIISEFYDTLNAEDNSVLEIVYVSLDRDEESFNNYYSHMPFSAIPFNNKDTINNLKKYYDIKSLPTLVIIDTSNGQVVDWNGVSTIVECKGNLRKATMSW
jgi:thiol-disulfide isomerase/thioredoxin